MLVNNMAEYATIVRDFDLKLAKAKEANDMNYYREEYARLDNARRRQHDAVIANLATANRINESECLEPVLDVGDGKSVHDVHRTDVGNASYIMAGRNQPSRCPSAKLDGKECRRCLWL